MIQFRILERVRNEIESALMTQIAADDPARAGIVLLGNLQGDPDPDVARISVSVYQNDPDAFISGALTGMKDDWSDEVKIVEIGGATTWQRCFSIKARCLLENTHEGLEAAARIASTVRTRIEHALPLIDFSDISEDGEYISRRIISYAIRGEMFQSGGAPDSYDFFIKVRFDLLTTGV